MRKTHIYYPARLSTGMTTQACIHLGCEGEILFQSQEQSGFGPWLYLAWVDCPNHLTFVVTLSFLSFNVTVCFLAQGFFSSFLLVHQAQIPELKSKNQIFGESRGQRITPAISHYAQFAKFICTTFTTPKFSDIIHVRKLLHAPFLHLLVQDCKCV